LVSDAYKPNARIFGDLREFYNGKIYILCLSLKILWLLNQELDGRITGMGEMRNAYILFRKQSEWLPNLMNPLIL
jgi:hypothetical protein